MNFQRIAKKEKFQSLLEIKNDLGDFLLDEDKIRFQYDLSKILLQTSRSLFKNPKKHISSHDLRHSYAKYLLSKDLSLIEIALLAKSYNSPGHNKSRKKPPNETASKTTLPASTCSRQPRP